MSETFKADDGGAVRLGRELGHGGEGAVHEVEGQPGLCAKVYNRKADRAHLQGKLVIMAANPPQDPSLAKGHRSIAWPMRLLYRGAADAAHFAGFVMPKISLHDFKTALCRFHPSDRVKQFGGGFTWRHAYHTAWNISSTLAAIHERGYCVGDINESNILVSSTTLVTLIDCDSFQVRDAGGGRTFRCPVGKPDYTAPELIGKSFDTVDRTAASDNFGLAVMMFNFLMEGSYPFQARGALVAKAGTIDAKIKLGYFPYPHPGKRQGVDPPAHAPPFEMLHPEIQKLFIRAFVDGHKDPSARPTSREWYNGLHRALKQIIPCGANPHHQFFSHLGACPWCRIREKSGNDSFPAPYQRGVGAPARGKAARRPGPVLKVGNAAFAYRDVSVGATIRGRLRVENTGAGALSGSIASNRPWLRLSRPDLDGAARRQDIGFEINTSGLAAGSKDRAEIEVKTNGGAATVTVELEIGSEKGIAAGGSEPALDGGVPVSSYSWGGAGIVIILAAVMGALYLKSTPGKAPDQAKSPPAEGRENRPGEPKASPSGKAEEKLFQALSPDTGEAAALKMEAFLKSLIAGGIDARKLLSRGGELEKQGYRAGAYAAFKAAEEMGVKEAGDRKAALSQRLTKSQSVEAMRIYGAIESQVRTKVEAKAVAAIEWVNIPAGKFKMGSEKGESNERPVHDVTLSAFQISKSEATVGQYKACVEAGRCAVPAAAQACNWDKKEAALSNHPVACVSWDQARAFCGWAGGRLPTEAEWEYAARGAGKAWEYPWGMGAATCARAVMQDAGAGCGTAATLPACSRPEGNSGQGLCDMAGNVWEWTADYSEAYVKSSAMNPQGPPEGELRVVRGGSFEDEADRMRAAGRGAMPPRDSYPQLGFRCARDAAASRGSGSSRVP